MPSEGTLAEIYMAGFDFAPKNYLRCQGQILSIAQNTALFSLLGTTYGGNGQTTFALPNCQGRVVIGAGQGTGLPNYPLGQTGGNQTVTLTVNNMPAHTHDVSGGTLKVSGVLGNTFTPVNNYPALGPAAVSQFKGTSDGSTLAAGAVQVTMQGAGGGQPFNNRKPYVGLNYYICVAGIYPYFG